MRREGQVITVETVGEAALIAEAAAGVCTNRQLWEKPEILDLWEINEADKREALPVELSVGASRVAVRGLRHDAVSNRPIRRLVAGLTLIQLDLPRTPRTRRTR